MLRSRSKSALASVTERASPMNRLSAFRAPSASPAFRALAKDRCAPSSREKPSRKIRIAWSVAALYSSATVFQQADTPPVCVVSVAPVGSVAVVSLDSVSDPAQPGQQEGADDDGGSPP